MPRAENAVAAGNPYLIPTSSQAAHQRRAPILLHRVVAPAQLASVSAALAPALQALLVDQRQAAFAVTEDLQLSLLMANAAAASSSARGLLRALKGAKSKHCFVMPTAKPVDASRAARMVYTSTMNS
eukprot:CAMPEP_0181499368 /NCGR_PEP_ID=MMETSP1110-20121109/54619_1 /TAXON_ID=174948 /ORGANISM="Symbiodinium sp., Strain CCMP421" /LENGTH=126 /DNA_ID=CAMNT_0023627545 /DNA_START=28 /DNA_END=406 /DNA_ORIENTATION=+